MKDISSLSINEFLEDLGSSSPTPGGGSASALCASIASRLTQMVASLTIGRPRFEKVQEEMTQAVEKGKILSGKFLDLAMKDSEAYDLFMKALSLPKDDEQEKARRKDSMQEALKRSTLVPLQTLELAKELVANSLVVAEKGNPNAITDAGVSALLADAAARGAAMNVKINLASIEDESFVQDGLHRVEAELGELEAAVEKVLAVVNSKLPR
ncbi:MAG: cyclodeaminase/cyclohydrolase family protein [Thermovirgaceae bacterium]